MRLALLFPGIAFALLLFSSCRDTRQLTYFQTKFDTSVLSTISAPEPIVQKGDLLSIFVYSDNPQNTLLYNQPVINTSTVGGTSTPVAGYQVDEQGNILFQGLGPLHVEGLTKKQLMALLDSKLKDTLLQNPYYSVRFLNFKISVIGEISKPGVISVPSEKINILEALSLAGDFTNFARRDNILIIREENNKREMMTLDLTKTDILNSPNYYLKQNDIVVVSALVKNKSIATDQTSQRNIGLAISILTTAAIIINTVVLITR